MKLYKELKEEVRTIANKQLKEGDEVNQLANSCAKIVVAIVASQTLCAQREFKTPEAFLSFCNTCKDYTTLMNGIKEVLADMTYTISVQEKEIHELLLRLTQQELTKDDE